MYKMYTHSSTGLVYIIQENESVIRYVLPHTLSTRQEEEEEE